VIALDEMIESSAVLQPFAVDTSHRYEPYICDLASVLSLHGVDRARKGEPFLGMVHRPHFWPNWMYEEMSSRHLENRRSDTAAESEGRRMTMAWQQVSQHLQYSFVPMIHPHDGIDHLDERSRQERKKVSSYRNALQISVRDRSEESEAAR
jgi:hypothetical protein